MSPTFRSLAEPADQAANRQTASLAALAVTLLLIVVSLFLVDRLRAEAAFEDCVLSGRSACTVVAVP
jgi:hypothetical protein